MANDTNRSQDLLTVLREGVLVEQALQKAARQAIADHKREGLPLAIWRDGKVAWVSAEELEAEIADH